MYSPRYNDDDDERTSESGLALYNPDRVQNMGNGNKKQLLDGIEDTVGFLKDVGGYTDVGIDKMKVSEVAKIKAEVTKKMTVGKFKKWVAKGTKPEPVIGKVGRTVKDFITWPFASIRDGFRNASVNEEVLSIIFGVVTVTMIGLLVFRMIGV